MTQPNEDVMDERRTRGREAHDLSELITFRISAEDKAAFTEAGAEEGLSASAWIRSRLKRLVRQELLERRLAEREAAARLEAAGAAV
jgi:hypothetical protein